MRGTGRMLITRAGAATATNDQVQAGDQRPPSRSASFPAIVD